MAAQYELLKELLNSGTTLNFEQEFFFKFYQAFILKDRWTQYIKGVSTTLLVTAIALALGIVLGSVVATIALVLPSLILMILISRMFMKYMQTPTVQSVFMGLRPAVVGLLAAAALLLMTKENFSSPDISPWHFWISIALFIATFFGTRVLKINPIRMILWAGFAGLMLLY